MKQKIAVCIVFAFWLVSVPVFAESLKLHPSADLKVLTRVRAFAEKENIYAAQVSKEQSFRLNLDGDEVGTLVTGTGQTQDSSGQRTPICFAAYAKKDGEIQLARSNWYTDNETLTCHAVRAVGLISRQPDPVMGSYYIVVMHDTTRHKAGSPDLNLAKTSIFSLDKQAHHFKMDPAATYKDSSATQVPTRTIKDVRKDWIFAKHFLYFINGVDTYEDEE